jgi:hypothetical protein
VNVLLLTSHAIAERDDLDMFTRMGVPCYSIGGAYDEVPFEGKRPAIPNVIRYPELEAATNEQRARLSHELGDPRENIDWGKARLAPKVIDWADTVIVHHFPEQWIGGNWAALQGKRIIWRTCGQSDPRLESVMGWYARQGLQIVRYSPKEADAFTAMGHFAGQDALIRFGKDPDEWTGWTGAGKWVGNITQHMKQRGDACGYGFWEEATRGLNAIPAGPGSEVMGGLGELTYEQMRGYLRDTRVYLYTGTRPASYTLGLIEAMMTGTPVVAMPADRFWPSALYEADELATTDGLALMLGMHRVAAEQSEIQRARAIDLFGLDGVMAQWHDFLGTDRRTAFPPRPTRDQWIERPA